MDCLTSTVSSPRLPFSSAAGPLPINAPMPWGVPAAPLFYMVQNPVLSSPAPTAQMPFPYGLLQQAPPPPAPSASVLPCFWEQEKFCRSTDSSSVVNCSISPLIPCLLCDSDKPSIKDDLLLDHVAFVHFQMKRFRCRNCCYASNYRDCMNDHIEERNHDINIIDEGRNRPYVYKKILEILSECRANAGVLFTKETSQIQVPHSNIADGTASTSTAITSALTTTAKSAATETETTNSSEEIVTDLFIGHQSLSVVHHAADLTAPTPVAVVADVAYNTMNSIDNPPPLLGAEEEDRTGAWINVVAKEEPSTAHEHEQQDYVLQSNHQDAPQTVAFSFAPAQKQPRKSRRESELKRLASTMLLPSCILPSKPDSLLTGPCGSVGMRNSPRKFSTNVARVKNSTCVGSGSIMHTRKADDHSSKKEAGKGKLTLKSRLFGAEKRWGKVALAGQAKRAETAVSEEGTNSNQTEIVKEDTIEHDEAGNSLLKAQQARRFFRKKKGKGLLRLYGRKRKPMSVTAPPASATTRSTSWKFLPVPGNRFKKQVKDVVSTLSCSMTSQSVKDDDSFPLCTLIQSSSGNSNATTNHQAVNGAHSSWQCRYCERTFFKLRALRGHEKYLHDIKHYYKKSSKTVMEKPVLNDEMKTRKIALRQFSVSPGQGLNISDIEENSSIDRAKTIETVSSGQCDGMKRNSSTSPVSVASQKKKSPRGRKPQHIPQEIIEAVQDSRLTTNEAAEKCGVPVSSIYNHLTKNALVCDVCGKLFRLRHMYNSHLQIHENGSGGRDATNTSPDAFSATSKPSSAFAEVCKTNDGKMKQLSSRRSVSFKEAVDSSVGTCLSIADNQDQLNISTLHDSKPIVVLNRLCFKQSTMDGPSCSFALKSQCNTVTLLNRAAKAEEIGDSFNDQASQGFELDLKARMRDFVNY